MRLARTADPPSEADFANAHLGWGILEHDQGRYVAAEWHFLKAARAALRVGRRSLAAAAYHNLLVLAIDMNRLQKAAEYAERAITLYARKHPRIPFLACDVGLLLQRLGCFSTGMYLFAGAIPWVKDDPLLALALFARSAAAVRDRVRYERLTERVLETIQDGSERAGITLYNLAEGARSFEQWDRAEQFARRASNAARARNNQVVLALTEQLLEDIGRRRPGDRDIVPKRDGIIDRITVKVLDKLRRMPAPESADPGTGLFPERYPVD